MRKYLELFKDGFDATIAEKTKVKNWPFVGYSPSEGVVFTVIPEPVTGPADNEIWYTSKNGSTVTPYETYDTDVFGGANIVSNTYENGKGVITFDGDVTKIGRYAFRNCYDFTSITIPNSVISTGESSFSGCNSLTSVTIGNSITFVENKMFYGCSSLTSITIPNNVKRIGSSAFYGCSSLTSITIPNSVTRIQTQALSGCSGLTSIIYEGTQAQWNNITKGSDWNSNVPATYVQCSDGQVTL